MNAPPAENQPSDPLVPELDSPSAPSFEILAVLAAVAIGLRLALLNVNHAEYTDGILQLTLFSSGNPYWPPLYSALAVLTGKAVGNLELGGRLVSAVVGGLAAVPIAALGARIGGKRAGVWAAALFVVTPEALRWGLRVMTDATFLTLFATALWAMAPSPDNPRQGRRLAWATLAAVLATLTRYQGLVLILPLGWELIHAWRRKHPLALPLAAQALWLAVPLWVARGGFAHAQQMAQRTGADIGLSLGETLLSYWNLAESYVLLFPYSLTPPLFLCFLGGLFSTEVIRRPAGRWFLAVFVSAGTLILMAQAVFGIFEFRYLLPLLAFVLPYAGAGLDRLDRALARRRAVALAAVCAVFGWLFVFSAGSLILQHEAFGDIKRAAEYAAQVAGPHDRILSNECYNERFPVVKTSFWAEREVLPAGIDAVQTGDFLILSSLYAGGQPLVEYWEQALTAKFKITRLTRYEAYVLPLLPDIMSIRGAHGSPLAWFYRYQWQKYFTLVLRIGEAKQ